MTNFILTEDEAIVLAQQQFEPNPVKLSSINFNWGAPISGRHDTDEMMIRVKVNKLASGKLFLHGRKNNDEWNVNIEFTKVGDYREKDSSNEFTLYTLRFGSQYDFPVEFVLRYDTSSGESYYDNNNGQNYTVTPYAGLGGNAIVGGNAIFDLGEISNYKAYFQQFD